MNILAKTPEVQFSPATHEASALAFAAAIGNALDSDITRIGEVAVELAGGPFKVMFHVIDVVPDEVLASLPNHLDDTGNNPRFYKTKKKNADGKEKMTDRDYYNVIADSLPSIVNREARRELLGKSMKDPTKYNLSDVPKDISDMPHHLRHAEIARLTREISQGKKAVREALELFSQFNLFQSLSGVTCDFIWAVNAKGEEMDGSTKDRPKTIHNTTTPIVITTKLERRQSIDTTRVGVSGFLKFDVKKALEQGGSWDALMATIKREKKEKDKNGADNAKLIRTPDTAAQSFTDLAEYFTTIQDQSTKADWEALKKSLHGPGSDDAFYNASVMFATLEQLVGDPKSKVRFQKLFADREQAAA